MEAGSVGESRISLFTFKFLCFSFNEEGKRTNFSFDVVEMSPGSVMVNIGTWSDTRGLIIYDNPFVRPRPPINDNPTGKT